jgi:L-ascorbate metabolism protein UlaG (beta-lactamase superfamily)
MLQNKLVYLRPNIKLEPLVDQWYAWSHLIPPATAAKNISERHLKIMDSYIGAPQIHANAIKNPKMLGGPFIDYGGKRVEEIKALRDHTKKFRNHLIEMSAAFTELDSMLKVNANGFTLHPLYSRVPEILRGYVELVYDLNNNPGYRVLEPLIYKSRYYDERAQSIMLSFITEDDRPFVLSTPRLEGDDCVHLHTPFGDERLDRLFKLKRTPKLWSEVRSWFDIPEKSEQLFASFFTTDPPSQYKPYCGGGIRWRYFGHACILIETRDISILVDPVLSYAYESGISRYTYEDLPDKIDYVLITHNHQDHILFETLLQLRHKIGHIIVPRNAFGMLQDPSLSLMFQQLGFKNVLELSELDTIDIPGGFIMGLPFFGEHSDLAIGTKLAHLVRIGYYSLLFAVDSCNIESHLYEHLHQIIGNVDVIFIGMECDGAPLSWLYGPLLPQRIERAMDESRRLSGSNYDQAISIVNQFCCKEVYVYAMGQEPWLNYVMSIKYEPESRPIVESNKIIEDCMSRGIYAERLFGEKETLIEEAAIAYPVSGG